MKKYLLLSALCLVAGCASPVDETQYLTPAVPIIEHNTYLAVPNVKTKYRLLYGNDASLENAFQKYLSGGRAPNIITQGFVKFAYNMGQQPIVKTTPFQETVISLEPGEHFTNVTSGDPSRWSYSVAVSGNGELAQQHILVKPSLPNLSTNMVITTDRRMYNLKLVATDKGLTRTVSFWYPEEMVEKINHAASHDAQIMPDVHMDNLNFNYSIRCGFGMGTVKPLRVFDDGVHTYIEFSPKVSNRDLPALFILNGNSQELVNYRVKTPYFVVDKIFQKAALVIGVKQNRITLINNRY